MTSDTKVGLLRLDINGGEHRNKDGTIVSGNHLHILTNAVGDLDAIEFDLDNKNLETLCLEFLDHFKVIDLDEIGFEHIEKMRLFN